MLQVKFANIFPSFSLLPNRLGRMQHGKTFFTCPANSTCENVPGSYRCRCKLGLAGTGLAGTVKECGGKFLTVNLESPAENV